LYLVDAYVRPAKADDLPAIIELEKKIGYKIVGVDDRFFRHSFNTDVKIFPVRVISAKSEDEAKSLLRNLSKNEVVIAQAKDVGALRTFSKDRRANIIEIPPRLSPYLDRNQADLFSVGKSMIGFNASNLIDEPRLFWWLSFLISYAERYALHILVYSGARRFDEVIHPKVVLNMLIQAGVKKGRALMIIGMSRLEEILKKKVSTQT